MHDTIHRIFENRYETFFLISGPCAVESEDICQEVAGYMRALCLELDIPYIFKSSIRKANRTRLDSFTGIGDEVALGVLERVKQKHDVAITTDIHASTEVKEVSAVVDMLQIPAFLCRQTELLVAAGKSNKAVNIKKGQFMSGGAMAHAYEKVYATGNPHVLLTERGNSFGYQDLVVDARNIDIMSRIAPVVMDVSHATQRTNQPTGVSGGDPLEIEHFGKIGLTAGARGIFMEVHPDPAQAKSDGASMLALSQVRDILIKWRDLSVALRSIYA
jgi:2-dehydro-3-deoxyphosphooctonate aldolase (KDO 8-P synthase)